MKAHICLILICLTVFFRLNAQIGIAGNEQYNSYEQCIYIDNLTQKLTSDILDIKSSIHGSNVKVEYLGGVVRDQKLLEKNKEKIITINGKRK